MTTRAKITDEQFYKIIDLISAFLQGHEQAINDAFSLLDLDGSGKIEYNEIKAFIEKQTGGKAAHKIVQDWITKADQDGDGMIDLQEFKDYIESKNEPQQMKSRLLQ